MKKDNRNRIHFLEKKLRELINSWELIPGSPRDEFDTLNRKILSALMNSNNDFGKLNEIIESYLKVDLGFFTTQNEIENKVTQVISWWQNEQNEY